ncbi:MAG: MoxR family ATPase [Thermoanaerobaculia bacterium]
MEKEISQVKDKLEGLYPIVDSILREMDKVIVGQKYLKERLLLGLISDGHILLEGVPGLAKTLAVSTLSKTIKGQFQRIQFTPDFLPADIIGTMVYNPQNMSFVPRKGPIFANLILADEINRAPAKVQSALLEAMQEKQVTLGEKTHPLPKPFLVLATQNPIEQEGTYPLPEAQIDRFFFKLSITYPSPEEEREILERVVIESLKEPEAVASLEDILNIQDSVKYVYIDEEIKKYIVRIVHCTREPEKYNLNAKDLIRYGASPRATIYLAKAAQSLAFLRHRAYVIPEDIKYIGPDVLRHRIILSYEAEAEGISVEDIIKQVFDSVEAP